MIRKRYMYLIIITIVISAVVFTSYSLVIASGYNTDSQFEESNNLLSNCTEETSFTSKDDIEEIAEQYELGDSSEIDEIVYVPIISSNKSTSENTISTYEIGEE